MFETKMEKPDKTNRLLSQYNFSKGKENGLSQHSHKDVNEPRIYDRSLQKPMGSGREDVRFVPGIVQLAPKKNNREGVSVDTKLDAQFGPSCWLFVLDAILSELGDDAPFHVGMGKFLYPDGEELQKEGGGRVKAIELALDKMDKLIQRFKSINQNEKANKNLEKNTVARIFHGILQNSGAWERAERLTDFLPFNDGPIAVGSIIEKLEEERPKLETLHEILGKVPEDKTDAEAILGTEKINLGSNYGTIVSLKLDFMDKDFSLPLYMSVNRRFSPGESNKFDFTDDAETKTKTRGLHAILITNLQYGNEIIDYIIPKKSTERQYTHFSVDYHIWSEDDSKFDDGFVEYKDPNYGNEIIKIKWSQFMEMSQDEPDKDKTIFSFVSSK